ncbi:MAG TPA: pantoate--beta-alanine ligase [Candidatus Humimicrobiaceae bacterium]
MEIIQSVKQMQDISLSLRKLNETIGFVPTMGYLHKGHISLIKQAKNDCTKVILSIFVNPTQFGKGEDYEKYPKDLNRDKILAETAGSDYVFVPSVGEMYAENFKASVKVKELDFVMCGSFRPGHFEGVCTVVAKLFNIALPHRAYFGLKDYQQYLIIKKMVEDLNFPIRIVGCPIIREDDGVAMSSRNKYLSKSERKNAAILVECLNQAANLIKGGFTNLEDIHNTMCEKLSGNPFVSKVDYFDFRDSETLENISSIDKHDFKRSGSNLLIACAIRIGGTRLIDNTVFDIGSVT